MLLMKDLATLHRKPDLKGNNESSEKKLSQVIGLPIDQGRLFHLAELLKPSSHPPSFAITKIEWARFENVSPLKFSVGYCSIPILFSISCLCVNLELKRVFSS